jgi:hypothetical protein
MLQPNFLVFPQKQMLPSHRPQIGGHLLHAAAARRLSQKVKLQLPLYPSFPRARRKGQSKRRRLGFVSGSAETTSRLVGKENRRIAWTNQSIEETLAGLDLYKHGIYFLTHTEIRVSIGSSNPNWDGGTHAVVCSLAGGGLVPFCLTVIDLSGGNVYNFY